MRIKNYCKNWFLNMSRYTKYTTKATSWVALKFLYTQGFKAENL
ncbi:hypothetical protein BCF58_0854 [Chryseobacterium defluvii]|uniref:Uncharacterized protein n=1 Tax=Chryseobacterium defluvii TaxID=160396 RepID=A0A495SMX0_9FLAO|nr:hypothetical protein BCF58_0854 [Chryseobacterium defluvii]